MEGSNKAGIRRERVESNVRLTKRPRRNRRTEQIRGLHRETQLSSHNLILPLFIKDGGDGDSEESKRSPIAHMPECYVHSIGSMIEEAKGAFEDGIPGVALFPKINSGYKTPTADECYNPTGLIPRAVHMLKKHVPGLLVVTDVALDPYSSDGHDGIVRGGVVVNDETVQILCKQAVCHAAAGADIIAPSDMMDGRIGEIRRALDNAGFTDVIILSYTAKYASSFYGPFRSALDSAPRAADVGEHCIPKDKKTYQMDPSNAREALRELALDEEEGADICMVKPATPYLDVILKMRMNTTLPIAAYQVSGEYSMLYASTDYGMDLRDVVMEALIGIRRAGADMIFTYYARKVAKWLRSPR